MYALSRGFSPSVGGQHTARLLGSLAALGDRGATGHPCAGYIVKLWRPCPSACTSYPSGGVWSSGLLGPSGNSKETPDTYPLTGLHGAQQLLSHSRESLW